MSADAKSGSQEHAGKLSLCTGEALVALALDPESGADLLTALQAAIAGQLPSVDPRLWATQCTLTASYQGELIPVKSSDDVAKLLANKSLSILHTQISNDFAETGKPLVPPESFIVETFENKSGGFGIITRCCDNLRAAPAARRTSIAPMQLDDKADSDSGIVSITASDTRVNMSDEGESSDHHHYHHHHQKKKTPPECPLIEFADLDALDPRATKAFVTSMRANGYVRVNLPREVAQLVREYHTETAAQYFAQTSERKRQVPLEASTASGVRKMPHRYGYFARADMGKELFQVRLSGERDPWPTEPADFRARSLKLFAALEQIGIGCVRAIGAELSDCSDAAASGDEAQLRRARKVRGDAWAQLIAGASPSDDPLCSSLLDVFNYHSQPAREQKTCDMHTDYGLLTLIPAQTGAPGLEILNWHSFTWDQVEEKNSNPGQCIVFASESLQLLTSGVILPTAHRVVLSADAKPRVSTPFLLFARPDAELNPRGLAREWSDFTRNSLAGMLPNSLRAKFDRRGKDCAITSGEFVLAKVRETPSVTFDKMYNSSSNADRKQGASSSSASAATVVVDGDEDVTMQQRRAILSGVRGMQMMSSAAPRADQSASRMDDSPA